MKIKDNKKQGIVFSNLYTSFKNFIDPEKEDFLLNDISLGIGNRIASRKFSFFTWPLWLTEAENFYSPSYHPSPGPVLLNTNFREWQTLSNYLSSDEIYIDRSGMITGPGNASWSIEFWHFSNGRLYQPQKNYMTITPVRDYKTGIIDIAGKSGNAEFIERIAGGKSDVNEALVSYQIDANANDDIIFIVVRPYNCLAIGDLNSIEFEKTGYIVKINGKQHLALDKKPDFINAGSGTGGDICVSDRNYSESVFCNLGMASMALGFSLKKGSNVFYLRISLEKSKSLSPHKFDFIKSFKEFHSFTEMRINEGLKIEIPDEDFNKIFCQSRITILNNNLNDFNIEKIDGFRNLYFYSYAMNRAGLEHEAEKVVHMMLEKFKYNRKYPDYISIICSSFLLNSFYECYIHRREMEYLQTFFPVLRQLGDYIYRYSTEIHSINQLAGSSDCNNYIKEATDYDFIIILSAMINISYLSRCMGIFGDEAKYKNEAERIQSVIKNDIAKRQNPLQNNSFHYPPLISFPEAVLTGYTSDEYKEFFINLSEKENYPVFNNLTGIDLFLSVSLLIHLIALKDERFYLFYDKCMSLIDDYFILPEFIDPVTKRGVWGDGNSKVVASLFFILMRNRILLDRVDRLEIFPAPEKKWFLPGNKIKVQNASTRYGKISFTVEIYEDEIKLSFIDLPKFIPSDIMINLPIDTAVIDSDDFILKKKVDNCYIINGWPSVIRFSIRKISESPRPAL